MASAPQHSAERAVTRVWQIVELVEQIALGLPLRDILKLQRVSRFQHRIVRNSLVVQQKLHFTVQASAHDPDDDDKEETAKLVPTLPSHMCLQFMNKSRKWATMLIKAPTSHYATPQTWEKMFLTQPPIELVIIEVYEVKCPCSKAYHLTAHKEVEKESGLKLGNINAAAQEALRTHRQLSEDQDQDFYDEFGEEEFEGVCEQCGGSWTGFLEVSSDTGSGLFSRWR